MRDISWLNWPIEYKKSGIGKYSSVYIDELKKTIKIHDIWFKMNPNSIRRILLQFLIIPLRLMFKKTDIKVFSDEWRLPILLYPIKNIICIIHDIRNYDLTTKKQSPLQRIYFKIIKSSFKRLNKVQKIITPSEFTKNSLISLWIDGKKIGVIPNIIDKNIYHPLHIEKSMLKKQLFDKYSLWEANLKKKILLNVWSEEDRKNIITILKALKDFDNCIFIKIGKAIIGENRKKHLDFVKKNRLNCVFIDEVNEWDLVSFYNVADIFIFPSLFEGFGRPPIEAQACWCPVIASKKWWLKEVVDGSCIILNNPLDEKEIAKKIKLCIINDKLRQDIIKKWYHNARRFVLDNNVWKWGKILQEINTD